MGVREASQRGQHAMHAGRHAAGISTSPSRPASPSLRSIVLIAGMGRALHTALRLCLSLRRSVGPWISRLPRQLLYLVPAPPSCPHSAALTLGETETPLHAARPRVDEELTPSLVRLSEPACSNTAIATRPTGDWISGPVSGQCRGRSVRLSDNVCSQRAPPRIGAVSCERPGRMREERPRW